MVINIKGPSASGKSTVRPRQRALAGEIGANPDDFAVISPDIWRKQLIDYATLGDDYRYGGAFTADEIFIVDQKLDRYMARKAQRGAMTHLLIDRFRFDSFAHDSDEAGSNLLTRFGQEIYLTFIITPPESLVVRAWNRGLEVGRYKAVDDTLAHAIEAYAGMPGLFFTWIERTDKRVHVEFLDNSVQQGERPRTVAFGWNDELNVLDIKCLLDVERFQRIDVDAKAPESLYRDRASLAPEDEHRVPAAMRAAHSRGQFRGPGHGANLREARVGQARFRRCRRARRRGGGFGNARRIAHRRARAVRRAAARLATGRAIWPTPPCERARTRWGRGAAPDQMPANHW